MKILVFGLFCLFANSSFAQEGSICDASKTCAKACNMKDLDDGVDGDPVYQKLLLKCAEDVAKKMQLIK